MEILKAPAKFKTDLAIGMDSDDLSFTLSSGTDLDGNALSGRYGITIDRVNSRREVIIATISGTAGTITDLNGRGISFDDGITPLAARRFPHDKGAVVEITDYPVISRISRQLNADEDIPNIITFDAAAAAAQTGSVANEAASVDLLNRTAFAGTPLASDTVAGRAKLSVAAADPANPKSVGDNDGRVPTQAENDALQGSSGTPSGNNRYETENDATNGASLSGTTVSFDSGTKEIRDSGNGFVAAGFRRGMTINVSGSASNSGAKTAVSVSAGAIVVSESITTESAGPSVTVAAESASKLAMTGSDGKVPTALMPEPAGERFTLGETVAKGNALYLKSDGKLWKASNATLPETSAYVGIANEAGAADASKLVKMIGQVSGFSFGNETTSVSSASFLNRSTASATDSMTGGHNTTNVWKTWFTVPQTVGNVEKIELQLGRQGVPSGTIVVTLYDEGTATTLATQNFVLADFGSTGLLTKTFNVNANVAPGSILRLTVQANNGSLSGTDYWQIGRNTTSFSTGFFEKAFGATPTNTPLKIDDTVSFKAFSTLTRNYYVGGNAYVSGTAGTIVAAPPSGTRKRAGRTVSASVVAAEQETAPAIFRQWTITPAYGSTSGFTFTLPFEFDAIAYRFQSGATDNREDVAATTASAVVPSGATTLKLTMFR